MPFINESYRHEVCGLPGFRARDLVFGRHHMAIGADMVLEFLKSADDTVQKSMRCLFEGQQTAVHAIVYFKNGYSVSVISMVPPENGLLIYKGDLRIPTYEVMISDDSSPNGYFTESGVDAILEEVCSRPPLTSLA